MTADCGVQLYKIHTDQEQLSGRHSNYSNSSAPKESIKQCDSYSYVCVTDRAPGQYRPIQALTAAPFGHVSSTVLPGCVVNKTFITRMARLPEFSFFSSFFVVVVVLGVKVRSISCNIGPPESGLDRSRMSGIGKLHDDGHVPCNKLV